MGHRSNDPNLKLFRTLHSSLFTDQVNDLIMKTAKAIATHLQAKTNRNMF
jgi:hypothetical protein